MFQELGTVSSIILLILFLKFEGKLALAPPNLDYAGYHKYTDEMLPSESPVLYGLHHNAEVGYLTAASDNLFKTLLEMLPMNSSVGEGSGQSAEENVKFFIWCVVGAVNDMCSTHFTVLFQHFWGKKEVPPISKDQLSVNSSDNAPACAMYCTREESGPEEHLTCCADCFFFSLNSIWRGKQEITLSCCFLYKQVSAHSPVFFLPHLEHSPAVIC